MFFHVRIIAAAVFSLIVFSVYLAGNHFQSMIIDHTIKPSLVNQGTMLTQNFYNNVWKAHPHTEDGQVFSNHANSLIRPQALLKFFIHTSEGSLIYTTNNRRLRTLSDNSYSNQFNAATEGKVSTKIMHNISYRDQDMSSTKGDLLRIIVPLRGSEDTPIEGVAIIYHDITHALSKLQSVQAFITIVVAVISIILFFALYIISYRAEHIILVQESSTQDLIDAKEHAEAQNQEKSQFLANVSHELRTPLNAIIGFSDIIKGEVMGPVGNSQYKEYARDINASGIHLLSLINDILDFSKAEAGKLHVDNSDMDLTKVIKTSLRIISPKAKESGIKLIEEIPDEHIVIVADVKRVKQVLLNLLSNAVKFTPEGGDVRLIVEKKSNKVTIEVRDSGIGISAKDISKAMSSFGQIDSSLSRKHDGTGLGLPFSKRLVEMMGGVFSIKSEDTLGTSITIIFPNRKKNTQESA